MDGAQFRTIAVDLRFRSQGSQRLVSGQMVPFQSPTEIGVRLVEEFLPGAFKHQLTAPHRVALRAEHSDRAGSIQLGSGMGLEERRDGLWGEFKVARSPMGDHYLALLDDGLLEEWSIGFYPERERLRDGITQYQKATVFEIALTPAGAYGEQAKVALVRDRPRQLSTPNLDRWRGRFAS